MHYSGVLTSYHSGLWTWWLCIYRVDCSTYVLCARTLSPGSISRPKTSQLRTPEPGGLYRSQYCQPGIKTPEERDGKSGVAGQVFTFGWGKLVSNLLCPASTLQTHLLSNKMDDTRLALQGAGKLCDCCIKAITDSFRSLMRPRNACLLNLCIFEHQDEDGLCLFAPFAQLFSESSYFSTQVNKRMKQIVLWTHREFASTARFKSGAQNSLKTILKVETRTSSYKIIWRTTHPPFCFTSSAV